MACWFRLEKCFQKARAIVIDIEKSALWRDVNFLQFTRRKSILAFTLAVWCKNYISLNETNSRLLKWRLQSN